MTPQEKTSSPSSSSELTRKKLLEAYSRYLLSKGKQPVSVYAFTQEINCPEADFYTFFSGFQALEATYFAHFFEDSLTQVQKRDDYERLSAKDKILNLYQLFFEDLKKHRSLIVMIFKTDFGSKIQKLKPLKKQHRRFIKSLNLNEGKLTEKLPDSLKNQTERPQEETLWLHFVSILKFWLQDDSAGFEKTTAYIEKSVTTGFGLVDNPITDKFIDLGKFLWRETFE